MKTKIECDPLYLNNKAYRDQIKITFVHKDKREQVTLSQLIHFYLSNFMKHNCKYRSLPVDNCPKPHRCPYADIEAGYCIFMEHEDDTDE